MSTDAEREATAGHGLEGRGRVRLLRAPALRRAPDAAQIARTLIEKYGADALALARSRAARAVEIGDHLALDSWRSVILALRNRIQPYR